jgi:hypothetical protein
MIPSHARKAPVKRAFCGMVGRDVSADVVLEQKELRYAPTSDQRFDEHQFAGRKDLTKALQGVTVFRIEKTADVSRADTPDWIRNPKLLDEYFERRSDLKSGFKITRALDRFILEDYFLFNHTDEIIFETHESSFDEERQVLGRKSRWTSSPDAVKHRRERLLRDRERFYEPPKIWTSSSWRGILVSTASGEWGAIELHGIATQKRKRKASRIADFYGLHGRFWEPAEIIADAIFDDRAALDSWAADHGIALDDVIVDDLNWR